MLAIIKEHKTKEVIILEVPEGGSASRVVEAWQWEQNDNGRTPGISWTTFDGTKEGALKGAERL